MSQSMTTMREAGTGRMMHFGLASVVRLEAVRYPDGEHTRVHTEEGSFRTGDNLDTVLHQVHGQVCQMVSTYDANDSAKAVTGYANLRRATLLTGTFVPVTSVADGSRTSLSMTDGSTCMTHERIPALIRILRPFSEVIDIQLPQLSHRACVVARHVERIEAMEGGNTCKLSVDGGYVVAWDDVDRLRDAIMVANGGSHLDYSHLEWTDDSETEVSDEVANMERAVSVIRVMLAGRVPSRKNMEAALQCVEAAVDELRQGADAPHP